jgi:hypothetical protein
MHLFNVTPCVNPRSALLGDADREFRIIFINIYSLKKSSETLPDS